MLANAEKILITGEGQITPCHFHWSKMEDIINRGGGKLVIEVYNLTEDEKPLYLLGNEYPEAK